MQLPIQSQSKTFVEDWEHSADVDERGAITNEALDAIQAAFHDEFPSFGSGRFTDGTLGLGPRPTQANIPIWIGGRGKPALRRVAERGDGWIPQGTPRNEMAGEI